MLLKVSAFRPAITPILSLLSYPMISRRATFYYHHGENIDPPYFVKVRRLKKLITASKLQVSTRFASEPHLKRARDQFSVQGMLTFNASRAAKRALPCPHTKFHAYPNEQYLKAGCQLCSNLNLELLTGPTNLFGQNRHMGSQARLRF